MAIARRVPHSRITAVRLAVANIHRPGALTPTIVLSLGLGLALLVTVIQIDGNLRRQFMAALPERAPSFYFVDIQSADADRFDAFIRERVPQAKLERVPMLRGRIVAANDIKAEDLKVHAQRRLGAAKRPRHHLRRASCRTARGLPRGDWWGAGLPGAAAGLDGEEDRRRPQPQDRRPDHRQRARPQHHRARSPTCAASTGRASASISCWCSRPARSPARRTPTSPR